MKKFFKSTVILSAVFIYASCSASDEGVLNALNSVSYSETYENATVQTAFFSETVIEPVSETTTQTETFEITEAESPPETEPEKETVTVSVCAVGDNLIHSPIYAQAESRAAAAGLSGGYDFDYAYSNVKEIISSYDLALINQETLICNDIYEPSNYPYFNSPAALGDYMIGMGFKVFSIANNHTLDQGTEGLNACLDFWESRNNVLAVGAYRSKADRADIRTIETGGIKFSFLSYTEHLNGLRLPEGSVLEIGDAKETAVMAEEIAKAKEISDVCVVFLHWGLEGSAETEPNQRNTARILAESGADIIIGTHPHVLRDIEYIERRDGTRAICAYSLGNFISAQNIPQTMIGGILTFDVVLFTETREAVVKDVGFIPTVTHYDENYRNVRIYKLADYTGALADSHGIRERGEFNLEYVYKIVRNSISGDFLRIDG